MSVSGRAGFSSIFVMRSPSIVATPKRRASATYFSRIRAPPPSSRNAWT
jgi:hypothetical protein